MKLNLIVIFLCTFISSAWANTADDFEQYKNKRQAELASYISKQHQEFAAYKLKIKEKWGYEEPNTKTQMVVYSDDLNQKVVVDYKTREIRVSLTPQTAQDDSTIQRVLLKLLTTPVQALDEQSQRESTGFTGQSESSKQQTLAESLGITPQILSCWAMK